MAGVYALLGFDTTDPIANGAVEQLSPSVQTQMKMMPKLLQPWQEADLISDETEDYYLNPVSNTINVIWSTSNTIINRSFSNVIEGTINVTFSNPGVSSIMNPALMVVRDVSQNVANSFMIHTDRISNVMPIDFDVTSPHYETAIGYGKIIMYIVNQTDNIQNNSPMLGSFSSLFVTDTLTDYSNTFVSISNVYLGSFVGNVSSLSLTDANQFSNAANQVSNTMTTYRQKDFDFFANSQMVVDRYNKVSEFNRIGQTELFLINDYIGTPNLKNNLANTVNTS
jgi:hypothetical protein